MIYGVVGVQHLGGTPPPARGTERVLLGHRRHPMGDAAKFWFMILEVLSTTTKVRGLSPPMTLPIPVILASPTMVQTICPLRTAQVFRLRRQAVLRLMQCTRIRVTGAVWPETTTMSPCRPRLTMIPPATKVVTQTVMKARMVCLREKS